MIDEIALVGGSGSVCAALGQMLRRAGWTVHERDGAADHPTTMLVTLPAKTGDAVAAAQAFAAADGGGRPRLIVLTHLMPLKADWQACREAAILMAFTRHAAVTSAPRDVRVNGIELGGGVADEDIADAILAMWRWRSMTGQTIRLDAR
jgi:hypothetical protein